MAYGTNGYYNLNGVQMQLPTAYQNSSYAAAPQMMPQQSYQMQPMNQSMPGTLKRIMAAFSEHRGRSETSANPQQQQKGGANR